MGEFELITRCFQRPVRHAVLGVGDDCALLQPRPGHQLAISSDMLVEGRHFFAGTDALRLGHKALAVNLSDLAACGARPLACTLALALPEADLAWCEAFAAGFFALADAHGCELVGGDTTRGPLNICVTVFGEVPVRQGRGQALLRSGAQPGDDLWVSGHLGDARLALEHLYGRLVLPPALLAQALPRLETPQPRVALGQALRGIATSAIDVSDGLLGDAGHVLKASGVGATIDTDAVGARMQARTHADFAALALPEGLLRQCTLAGGDDYELAFTAPPVLRAQVEQASATSDTPVARIGRIEAAPGLRLVDGQGRALVQDIASFDHFA
jgi:thiamine-monophosphate kinase